MDDKIQEIKARVEGELSKVKDDIASLNADIEMTDERIEIELPKEQAGLVKEQDKAALQAQRFFKHKQASEQQTLKLRQEKKTWEQTLRLISTQVDNK